MPTGPKTIQKERFGQRVKTKPKPEPSSGPPGGGETPLYKPYKYVPPHWLGFLRRFGLKTGIHFAYFGLESGMVFEGTTECMNVFIVSIPNE